MKKIYTESLQSRSWARGSLFDFMIGNRVNYKKCYSNIKHVFTNFTFQPMYNILILVVLRPPPHRPSYLRSTFHLSYNKDSTIRHRCQLIRWYLSDNLISKIQIHWKFEIKSCCTKGAYALTLPCKWLLLNTTSICCLINDANFCFDHV